MRCKHTRHLLEKGEKAWEKEREGREVQRRGSTRRKKETWSLFLPYLPTPESERGETRVDLGVLARARRSGDVKIIKF